MRYLLLILFFTVQTFGFGANAIDLKENSFKKVLTSKKSSLEERNYDTFRYYSPDSGTYISQDPIGLHSGEPNFYAYVTDSNSWVDVFGLSSAYEVDTYNKLRANDIKGDKLGNHHVPQKALAKTQVGGYPQTKLAGDAPAIRLPDAEHATITKLQSQNKLARSKMSASQLLQDDIDMLRKHTNAPDSSIDKLKKMNKDKYKISCH